MIVQMENGLAGSPAVVDDHPKIFKAVGGGHGPDDSLQMPQERLVSLVDRAEPGDVLLGDDQKMRGSGRVEILKRHRDIVLMDDLGRGLARGDFAEDAIRH